MVPTRRTSPTALATGVRASGGAYAAPRTTSGEGRTAETRRRSAGRVRIGEVIDRGNERHGVHRRLCPGREHEEDSHAHQRVDTCRGRCLDHRVRMLRPADGCRALMNQSRRRPAVYVSPQLGAVLSCVPLPGVGKAVSQRHARPGETSRQGNRQREHAVPEGGAHGRQYIAAAAAWEPRAIREGSDQRGVPRALRRERSTARAPSSTFRGSPAMDWPGARSRAARLKPSWTIRWVEAIHAR
jgi:hypothetical protein